MFKTLFFIAIGGALGSILRYSVTLLVNKFWSDNFPLATFITNCLGCFMIGFFIGFLERNNITNLNIKWFLITGLCGGFTTFSAFGFENVTLLNNNNSSIAFLYIGLSVITGLFAVWFGLFVSENC